MQFSFACGDCGYKNQAIWSQAGQKTRCGGCGNPLTVPAPREAVDEVSEAPQPSPIRFACPACGRKYATKPELAGKRIRCGGCGGGVRVPSSEGGVLAPKSSRTLKTFEA